MIKQDFHVHTTFCDGKSIPEQIVEKAVSLNFKKIGLVCHAYTPFDQSYCIKSENVQPFIDEISLLKEKYKGIIEVFCGVEYDYYSQMNIENFDYVIGAVHYVRKDGKFIPVDLSKESLIEAVNTYYGGDFYAFCSDYYKTLGDIYSKVTPNFIAHFDLVSKFNQNGDLFDENNQGYISEWKKCADKLLTKKVCFEVNIGAIVRGYKNTPYPSKEQIDYLLKRKAKFIVNSDCHNSDRLDFDYDKYINIDIKKAIESSGLNF